jgi:hypothetical protein
MPVKRGGRLAVTTRRKDGRDIIGEETVEVPLTGADGPAQVHAARSTTICHDYQSVVTYAQVVLPAPNTDDGVRAQFSRAWELLDDVLADQQEYSREILEALARQRGH